MHVGRTDIPLIPFFVTFGSGSAYGDVYLEIHAPDRNEAVMLVQELHSNRWSFMYEAEQFQPQIKEFGLELLAVIKPNEQGRYVMTFDAPLFADEHEDSIPPIPPTPSNKGDKKPETPPTTQKAVDTNSNSKTNTPETPNNASK